ncbi:MULTISPECIES: asparagine--tRNA ligase [Imperialibacter]|uniref:Asparagine--tRNA ligase n=1 Tax=Imperialibacter roseus TaxID=1324217 RepID=A0ABZ0ISC9_9BACT|nr:MULTISPECIES: asparagine--tRNA ligase [Imperialibacter]WOK06621.1 asparagine--tRNA ligase [Imperialibacter roseus]CAD5291026.1 asparaginyl tRNA synthetase [Imperialibacter sp. 89]CAD5291249.1 asparaginyl tRNA synthetase [Imperialibacter sp. 75]VVT34403.1 asparaginyl tRNA synthetase [Imperialibacter sp. EC-SDR9]
MSQKKRTKIKDILQLAEANVTVTVKGWVRTKRENKNVVFINLNDGSTINNLQIVGDPTKFDEATLKKITTGASLSVVGLLVASQGSGQKFELQADTIDVLGVADPEKFPLQPKKHSLEFLREIAHLRPRTNTFSAILRVRHSMIFAVHKFFHEKGFFNIHTPIITASDAEGAGEMFRVTTLDLDKLPKTEDGKVDFKEDFFEREANLTVSGQLEGELTALALSEIYTFGPTFRAENSNTTRHLAEFWMIEPEMAFYDLEDNMDLAEEMLKYLVTYALENCQEDLAFLEQRAKDEESTKKQEERSELSLLERLRFVADNEFVRLTYTEAIDILRNSNYNKKKKFQYLIDAWGADLQSEHERYLVEKHFKKPVILINYPKEIKSFYMKQNDDGKTVAAMDILFPGIGEIVGGSQREENYDKLTNRMKELDMDAESMWWFLDTRRFGTVPHSGFGLGFERLMLFVTGMSNIRDVIPFPRTPGNAEF